MKKTLLGLLAVFLLLNTGIANDDRSSIICRDLKIFDGRDVEICLIGEMFTGKLECQYLWEDEFPPKGLINGAILHLDDGNIMAFNIYKIVYIKTI